MTIKQCRECCKELKAPYRDKLSDDVLDELELSAFTDICINYRPIAIDNLQCIGFRGDTPDKEMDMITLYNQMLDLMYEGMHESFAKITDKYKEDIPKDILIDIRELLWNEYNDKSCDERYISDATDFIMLLIISSDEFLEKYDDEKISVATARHWFKIYMEFVYALKEN